MATVKKPAAKQPKQKPKAKPVTAEQRRIMAERARKQWNDPNSKLRNRQREGRAASRKKPPRFAVQLIERAINEYGATKEAIAEALGCDVKTFNAWLLRHEEIRTVFEKAKSAEEAKLVGLLYGQAMKGYAPAAMFLLKTRHSYRDAGTIPGQSDDPVAKAAQIKAALKAMQQVDGELGGTENAPLPSIHIIPQR
jgi:hypothetical protein